MVRDEIRERREGIIRGRGRESRVGKVGKLFYYSHLFHLIYTCIQFHIKESSPTGLTSDFK